ncbi:MAG: hypothetical protein CMO01_07350 [Thalassobius sp.]|nr:hypothetical protein [Thalassovita sp.]
MKTYKAEELSYWKTLNIYSLEIKKAKDFIIELIYVLPDDTLINFEGNLSKIQNRQYYSTLMRLGKLDLQEWIFGNFN